MSEMEVALFGEAKFAGFLMKALPDAEAQRFSEWSKGVTIRDSRAVAADVHIGIVSITERFNENGSANVLLVIDGDYFARADSDSSPLGDFALQFNAKRKLFEERDWPLVLLRDHEVEGMLEPFKQK